MKNKIKNKHKKNVKGKWTQMFATDFSFKFSCTGDLVTRIEIREEQQGRSFLFFYHTYWDGSDLLVPTYNQQMEERIQRIGQVVF